MYHRNSEDTVLSRILERGSVSPYTKNYKIRVQRRCQVKILYSLSFSEKPLAYGSRVETTLFDQEGEKFSSTG